MGISHCDHAVSKFSTVGTARRIAGAVSRWNTATSSYLVLGSSWAYSRCFGALQLQLRRFSISRPNQKKTQLSLRQRLPQQQRPRQPNQACLSIIWRQLRLRSRKASHHPIGLSASAVLMRMFQRGLNKAYSNISHHTEHCGIRVSAAMADINRKTVNSVRKMQ